MKKLILILFTLPLLVGATPYWFQATPCPWLYVNKDVTEIRLYGGTPADYAEVTIRYHGKMTREQALHQIKPYLKKP